MTDRNILVLHGTPTYTTKIEVYLTRLEFYFLYSTTPFPIQAVPVAYICFFMLQYLQKKEQ